MDVKAVEWWCVLRFCDSGKKIIIAPSSMIQNSDGSAFAPECAQDLPAKAVKVQWQDNLLIEASVLVIASKFRCFFSESRGYRTLSTVIVILGRASPTLVNLVLIT